MKLGDRLISSGHPVLIIAEIGVNHDGSLQRALELVEAAKHAGADAIKLQVFKADTLVHGGGLLADYQKQTTTAQSSTDLLKNLELSEDDLYAIHTHARHLRLLTVATPFSPSDVPVCSQLGLDALKIASPDIVNFPLLESAAETNRPMLLSTGAATLEEIDATHAFLGNYPGGRCYLHCISSYPTPDDQAHLGFISQLAHRYAPIPVGYSDHAQSLLSGAFAVCAGALVLERHLTYDKKARGPDHAASSDPKDFAEYVRLARQATTLRGFGEKRVLPIEQDVRKVSRQSLILTQDTPAGLPLTRAHLTPKRPNTGIPASAYPQLLGRTLKAPQKAHTLLTWDMLSD